MQVSLTAHAPHNVVLCSEGAAKKKENFEKRVRSRAEVRNKHQQQDEEKEREGPTCEESKDGDVS